MSLKLKALGLAVFAALAVGAVSVVSAAADEGGTAHSDVEWTHLVGEQEEVDPTKEDNVLHDFTLGRTLTCEEVTYTGSIATKTVGEVTLTPTYHDCHTDPGNYHVTVDMNECNFRLTFTDEAAAKHHTAHLVCPEGNQVTVTVDPPIVGECWIHIPPQTPTSGGVAYTNIKDPEKHAITANVTAEGITVTRTSVGFSGCAHSSPSHDNNTALTATAKITGFDTGDKQTNITVTTASS